MSVADLERSERLARARDPRALESLRAWLASGPVAQAELARAASIALSGNDVALALAVTERFVACAPRFPGSHHALGIARGQAGDFVGAARAFQVNSTAGGFASLGMALNALATASLLSILALLT